MLVLFVVATTNNRAGAQGSPYDFFGFGNPIGVTNSHLEGLSQSGVALTDGSVINELNPASYSFFNRTNIDVRLRFAYNQSDLAAASTSGHLVKFSGFNVGTLFWNKLGLGAAFGFAPVTDAEATTTGTDSISSTISKREGGLSQFYLGASLRPISALSLGGRVDVLFGNLLTKYQTSFNAPNIIPGVFQREYAESGIRGTFGFLLSLDSLFAELRGVTIGASYSTGASLTSTQRTIITPINTVLDSIIEVNGYGYYPSKIQIGIAGRVGDRYRLEADISGQDFSSAYTFSKTKNATGEATLGSSNRFSLGFERMSMSTEDARGRNFFDKIGYRIGVSYASLPFRPSPGVTVNELGASLGLGVPFASGSNVDFAGQFGIRTPSNTAVAPKDLFFKFGVTVGISEKWFVPLRHGDDDQ